MSSRTFLVTIAVALSACTSSSLAASAPTSSPVLPQPSPSEEPRTRMFLPTDVAFWDASRGLLGGQVRCRSCVRRQVGVVWATRDGGKSWTQILRAGRAAPEIAVVGRSTAFVQSGDRLYRTTNHGGDWAARRTSLLAELSFVTPRVGWAARPRGYEEHLVATSDGGASWQPAIDPCSRGQTFQTEGGWGSPTLPYLTDVSFVSADIGWVLCAGDGAGGSAPIGVFGTADGGRTWARRFASIDAEPGGLRFIADGLGWRWQNDTGWIDRSADEGTTWRHVGSFANGKRVSAISFTAAGIGIAIGERALWRSTDGGHSWHVVNDHLDALARSSAV
jgi:photosystem II stability/assembly factor-like uncharacterized protein